MKNPLRPEGMRVWVIRVDNPFFVPPFTERKEVKMRNTDISGYLVRVLFVLLVAGIAVAPVLGEQGTDEESDPGVAAPDEGSAVIVMTSAGPVAVEDLVPPYPPGWEPPRSPAVQGGLYPATAFDPASNTLILYPGWNLVSTPLWLADGHDTMMAIFGGVDTAAHSALRYNGSSSHWEAMGPLDEFRPLEGVWIYANGSYRIPLYLKPAQEQTAATTHLYSGWNVVGFWDVHQACARDMLLPLGSAWATATGYDAGVQDYEVSMVNGGTGSSSDQRLMFPGKAYWVYMTAEEDLIRSYYRSYSYCAEWVGDYHGTQAPLAWADEEAEGFYDTLAGSSSWTGRFINGNDAAMERHWKDPAFGGVDSNYIDNTHLAFFVGHGGTDGFVFGTAADDYNLDYDEARWGNTKTDWIVLGSCNTLNASTCRENWEDAFEGLHSICGFDTIGGTHPDMGWYFAQQLMNGETIWDAWSAATDQYVFPNDGSLRSAILAADIDGDLNTPDCLDDHIYGYGSSINPPGDPPGFQYDVNLCMEE